MSSSIKRNTCLRLPGAMNKSEVPPPARSKRQLFDIYVSNFSQQMLVMGDQELKELLEGIADMKCRRLTCKGTFCFFQIQGEANFEVALENISGAEVGGKKLIAQKAQGRRGCTMKQTKLSETLHMVATQNGITPCLEAKQFYLLERALRTLYVGNIPAEAAEDSIQGSFEQFGRIEKTILIADGDLHCGYGFVIFETHSDAEKAIMHLKPILLLEQQLSVQLSRPCPAIISIAHSAGLVGIDCQATPLLTSLLNAAKRHVASKLGSFSQAHVYMQDPTNGYVYVISEAQLPNYNAYLQTGQLIRVAAPGMVSPAPFMKPIGTMPIQGRAAGACQEVPQISTQERAVIPGVSMPHMVNSSHSFPRGYGNLPQQENQGQQKYNSYPPQRTSTQSNVYKSFPPKNNSFGQTRQATAGSTVGILRNANTTQRPVQIRGIKRNIRGENTAPCAPVSPSPSGAKKPFGERSPNTLSASRQNSNPFSARSSNTLFASKHNSNLFSAKNQNRNSTQKAGPGFLKRRRLNSFNSKAEIRRFSNPQEDQENISPL